MSNTTRIPPQNTFNQKPKRCREKRQLQKYKEHRPPSDFAALVDAIKSEGRAYRNEEQREDRGKQFREWITIGFIGLTFVAICYQVHEMIKVYEPIRDQAISTDASAKATTLAAIAATKQSEIATRQADSSDKAVIQAQRAWLGTTSAKLEGTLEAGKPIEVAIAYTNTGREPAINFVYSVEPFVSSDDEERRGTSFARISVALGNCRSAAASSGGQVVFPSTGFNAYTLTVKPADQTLDQEVIDGKKTLIVQGCFLYRSFDVVRHSYFCYFYRGKVSKPENLSICAAGHYAD